MDKLSPTIQLSFLSLNIKTNIGACLIILAVGLTLLAQPSFFL